MDNSNLQTNNETIITDEYINYREQELKTFEKKIRKSRNTLFYVAAATLLIGLLQIATNGYGDGKDFIFTAFISIIFLGLAFFTKKEPFAALVMGLIIYAGTWILLVAVAGPEYLFKGIIGKVIVIVFIASGIPHAQEAEKLKKELKDFKK